MRPWWFIAALIVAYLSLAKASAQAPRQGADDPPIKNLQGGWVLNKAWTGYMGVAIQFRGDGTFDYWQYSDVVVPNEPKYPVSGKWKWDGTVLKLESTHSLHATSWHLRRHKDEDCLLPDYAREWQKQDGKAHDDRLLFRISEFDPMRPFDKRR